MSGTVTTTERDSKADVDQGKTTPATGRASNARSTKTSRAETMVARSNSSSAKIGVESVDDLVPAGLASSNRDGLPMVTARFTKVGESLRMTVPHEMQCSMFCGGKRCKYEGKHSWKESEMAVPGIFSHWVTDDVLAMARPNTDMIVKGGLVEKMKERGIRSIINLQIPGEHASCGPKLNRSGFTYDPNDLMRKGIFFYNYAWKDFNDAPMNNLLDMVKVVSFAATEGKVAIHCHAGLGRTGVLIACYLVYYLRVRANDALRYVRMKRPGSVQTRRQIDCVKEFEAFFLPQCLVFSNKVVGSADKKGGRFTLDQYLKRQKMVLHGFEARSLKFIPKIVFRVCERLLALCSGGVPVYPEPSDNFTRHYIAYGFDDKTTRLLGFKQVSQSNLNSKSVTPSDSMIVTRRSSASLNNYDNSSGLPSPMSYSDSRPGSENSNGNNSSPYLQSCSSQLSGVDDQRLDEILADGIHGQAMAENAVSKELDSHVEHQRAVLTEHLPLYTGQAVYEALMDSHNEKIRSEEGAWATDQTVKFRQYKTDLNVRLSAWDRMESETDLFVLTALLFDWLEHLKSPVVDRDAITYVVIHCDNVQEALRRLPSQVCYLLEYLVRFVARLQPLSRQRCENIMRRLMASLTHQSVLIDDVVQPSGRRFPRLRKGTAESTRKFMMKLLDAVMASEGRPLVADDVDDASKMHRMNSNGSFGSSSLDVSATPLNVSADAVPTKDAVMSLSSSSSPSLVNHLVNAEVHDRQDRPDSNNIEVNAAVESTRKVSHMSVDVDVDLDQLEAELNQ